MADEYGDAEGYPTTQAAAEALVRQMQQKRRNRDLNQSVPVQCAHCGRKWSVTLGWSLARSPEEIFCSTSCQDRHGQDKPLPTGGSGS